MAGSSSETSVWVTRLTTGTSYVGRCQFIRRDCSSRYPISPWLAAPQTSKSLAVDDIGGAFGAQQLRANLRPIAVGDDQTISQTNQADHRLCGAAGVRQLLGDRPFLTRSDKELPPTATSAVFDIVSLRTLFAYSLFAIRQSLVLLLLALSKLPKQLLLKASREGRTVTKNDLSQGTVPAVPQKSQNHAGFSPSGPPRLKPLSQARAGGTAGSRCPDTKLTHDICQHADHNGRLTQLVES